MVREREILSKVVYGGRRILHIEVGDVDLDACKSFINQGKGGHRPPYFVSGRLPLGAQKPPARRTAQIDVYSRPGGSGRSRNAESSKLFKATGRYLVYCRNAFFHCDQELYLCKVLRNRRDDVGAAEFIRGVPRFREIIKIDRFIDDGSVRLTERSLGNLR